jgi:hypothetical protein
VRNDGNCAPQRWQLPQISAGSRKLLQTLCIPHILGEDKKRRELVVHRPTLW